MVTKKVREGAYKWFENHQKTKVIRDKFKLELPVKAGTKKFEAVEFDNGRKAVFCKGESVLKYAWE